MLDPQRRKKLIKDLQAIVGGDGVLHTPPHLETYGYDASLYQAKPEAVVLPQSTEEVSAVVRLTHREKIPIVARGSGTNLSGGSIPAGGGIVIHLSRMNRILEIDLPNQRAIVEPGVFNLDLQNALSPMGYLYAPDPASQKVSTMGGNLGENSGGPHCLKYGVTTNHLLGAEVVLPNGDILWTGGKALDSPGYDLIGLLVGSEGTLGVATKMILRIMRKPEAVETLLAIFNSLHDASSTVSAIIGAGIIPATLEMMDRLIIKAVEDSIHAGYPLDAEAVLIIELDGVRDGMDELAQKIIEICRRHNVREVKKAASEEERMKLWAGRKGAFGAVARLRPNYLVSDGTVPRTKLPEVLAKVIEVGKKYNLEIGNVFHAGDGNLHPLILFDARNPDELKRVHLAGSEILKACADVGGTISGEHGIGAEKMREMSLVFSPDDIAVMKRVKSAFDPLGLVNPRKVLEDGMGGVV